jgi:hypothetical protein
LVAPASAAGVFSVFATSALSAERPQK